MRLNMRGATYPCLLLLCISDSAAAYPTMWRIRNDTNRPIEVSCHSRQVVGLPLIESPPIGIQPRTTHTLDWGSRFYNDGMGLNRATWSCRAHGPSGGPLEGTFASDWDEALQLVIGEEGGKVTVAKIQPKSSVATKN